MPGYKCYYCLAKSLSFEDTVKHHEQNHCSEKLKIWRKDDYDGTAESNYRVRTYTYIPKDFPNDGKSIEIQGENIIVCKSSTSTPQKIVKKSKSVFSPVLPELDISNVRDETSLKSKRSLFTTNGGADDKDQSVVDKEIDEISLLMPLVLSNLKEAGKHETFKKFLRLTSENRFPTNNISFLLFLDVVNWFSESNSSQMKYIFPQTLQFWRIGQKLFHGRFLRFMSGPKNQGHVLQGNTYRGLYDPHESDINFAVPSNQVIRKLNPFDKDELKPGVFMSIFESLKKLDKCNTYKIAVDAKKISKGRGKVMGDIDLFGFEDKPLNEKLNLLENDMIMIKDVIEMLEKHNLKYLHQLTDQNIVENVVKSFKSIIGMITMRMKTLREVKLSLQRSVNKFLTMAEKEGKDWKKSGLLNVISSLKTSLYDTNCCLKKLLNTVDLLGYYIATFNCKQNLYVTGQSVSLEKQDNYHELVEDKDQKEAKYTKQRTENWHAIRRTAKVTGSTVHSALGLDTLKKQQEHFEQVINGKARPEVSEQQMKNMSYGVENEINVIATLTSKILPVFYPNMNYIEDGCYIIEHDGTNFMVVSPDGSIRRGPETDASLGFEAKCRTSNIHALPVYYSIPYYYVLQLMCEMKVLDVSSLIFICWSKESSVCYKVKFCEILWEKVWGKLVEIYGCETPKRPQRKSPELLELKAMIENINKEYVEILGEFPSAFVHNRDLTLQNPCHESGPYRVSCYPSSFEQQNVLIEDILTTLHELSKVVNDQYQLTRNLANEVLVFVLTDLDRVFSFEQANAHIIAYAMKGPSLLTETFRRMLLHVLTCCVQMGLHVPLVTSDSAFQRVAVRSADNKPLTILQLQKDVWQEVKRQQKSTLIAKFRRMNTYNDNDFQKVEEVETLRECPKTIVHRIILKQTDDLKEIKAYLSKHTFTLIQNHFKGGVKLKDNEADDDDDFTANDIMNFIPDEVLEDIDEETLRQAEEILRENVRESGTDNASCILKDISEDLDLEAFFEDERNIELIEDLENMHIIKDSNVPDCTRVTHNDINSTTTASKDKENTNFQLKNEDFELMQNHLKTDVKIHSHDKWKEMQNPEFVAMFKDKKSINSGFKKIELRICLESIIPMLREQDLSYGLSWTKQKLVDLFDGLVKGNIERGIREKNKNRKKSISKLRDMCSRVLQTFPKLILASIYAENVWKSKKAAWAQDNIFRNGTSISGFNTKIDWFSTPDVLEIDGKKHTLLYAIDAHHKLCSLRTKVCSSGLPSLGIQRQAWIDAAKSEATKLSIPLVTDIIDKQNNAFAQRTFAVDVENFMREHKYEKEADLCKLVRGWYTAEDEAGVSAFKRTELRLGFLTWLKSIGSHSLTSFPPPGKYIMDIPSILWEGLVITIERKLQLYPYCSHGSFNSRSTGTLEVENLFQSFQDLDPAGKGVLKPDDIPSALGTAVELDNYRLNPERPFSIRTTASSVYPIHPLDYEGFMEVDQEWSPPDQQIDAINVVDHFIFDVPDRRKSNPKRKKGDVRLPHEPSRGVSGVRKHHKRDESLILPHLRHGLIDIPDV